METQNSKTVFIEYSNYSAGQHYMTIIQNENNKRIIIGRIYRNYDKENHKYTYNAKDFDGNTIFSDTKELHVLKSKFKEHGPILAMNAMQVYHHHRQPEKTTPFNSKHRKNELDDLRKTPANKSKTKENLTPKEDRKTALKRIENQKDAENERQRGTNTSKETAPKEERETEKDQQTQDREDELEQTREQNEDRDQDLDMER
jgi:hypothetical protein